MNSWHESLRTYHMENVEIDITCYNPSVSFNLGVLHHIIDDSAGQQYCIIFIHFILAYVNSQMT